MAEDPQTGLDPAEDPGDPKDPNEGPEVEDPKDPAEGEKDPKPELDPEVKKAIARRDRALKDREAALEQLKALREKYEPASEDPEKRANRKLVHAEARVVLTGAGIPKDDQATVMQYLGLDDVEVGSDGEVDSDAITERVEALSRIFGRRQAAPGRSPRGIDSRDRGGERGKPVDPAKKRRMEMLG